MAIELTLSSKGVPGVARKLLERAREVADTSYNAYSGTLVGAAVLTDSGAVFAGSFMENASMGLTICAEPSAILAANSAGEINIRSIAIVGGDPSQPDQAGPCTPCGRCRQILWEVAAVNKRDVEVFCADLALRQALLTTSRELLPYPWGPSW